MLYFEVSLFKTVQLFKVFDKMGENKQQYMKFRRFGTKNLWKTDISYSRIGRKNCVRTKWVMP